MAFDTWLAFALASMAVVLIPGPNVVMTITYALRGGKRTGFATIPGVIAGAFVAMTVTLAGAGAVLTTSALLFTLLKLAGALYLMWLAWTLWSAPVNGGVTGPAPPDAPGMRAMLSRSFLISVLNPKGPVFYLAFMPQFVRADAAALPQFAILIATFLAAAAINSLIWLFFADALRPWLTRPRAMRAVNRSGAGCLATMGALTLRATRD